MKSDFEERTPNGGFLHELNNALTGLALMCLFWSFLQFLWKGKSTAWLGTALLFFMPVWLCVGFVVGESYWLVTDKCLTSDAAFKILTTISTIITLIVSVWMTMGRQPASGST